MLIRLFIGICLTRIGLRQLMDYVIRHSTLEERQEALRVLCLKMKRFSGMYVMQEVFRLMAI